MVAGSQFHRKVGGGPVFHAAIADTEPDGWGRRIVLRSRETATGARRSVKDASPVRVNAVDFLLAVDGGGRVEPCAFVMGRGV